MPMHEWTKVPAGIYHAFHGPWLQAIARTLNNGLLPPTYYALGEQVAATFVADILTLRSPSPPLPPLPPGNGIYSLTAYRPAVGVLDRGEKAPPRKRSGRRLTVRHVSTHKVVAVIELVSPGNKADRADYAAFVSKAADILFEGVHLLVIDPFPPPTHAPAGLHADIWAKAAKRRKGRRPFAASADRPLVAVGYWASSVTVTAAVQPFAVGESVPATPLFLTPDEEYVTVPLEDTYQAAWPDVPKVWRDVLAG